MSPERSLTWSRQYNGLVSLSTACLTVDVAVNKVPYTANLPCELQPNFLSIIMNMECSNYSEMQACPKLRLDKNRVSKRTIDVHYSENLPQVKRLFADIQLLNSRDK